MSAIAEKTRTEQIVPSHLAVGEDGVVRVAGTGLKVRILAAHHRYHGYTAEQLTEAHPDLTLAQAHSVLSYYYDHKAEMDADMDREEAYFARLRAEAGEPPFLARWRAEGRWPRPEAEMPKP